MDAGLTADAESLAAAQGDGLRGRVAQQLLKTRARWAEAAGQWEAAAQLLVQHGDATYAVSMCSAHGAWEVLGQLARRLEPKADAEALHALAEVARAAGKDDLARDVLVRLGDHEVRLCAPFGWRRACSNWSVFSFIAFCPLFVRL